MYYGPNRKLNRLPGRNYSKYGRYFVTICTLNREEFFGDITNGKMILNEYGMIAHQYLAAISTHYDNVQLDEFVIMPNHVHGIIVIDGKYAWHGWHVGTEQCSVPTIDIAPTTDINGRTMNIAPTTDINGRHYGLLSKIIKSFKNAVTVYIRNNFDDYDFAWQRSFHDHIIRNRRELNAIQKYIQNNPRKWQFDRNHHYV